MNLSKELSIINDVTYPYGKGLWIKVLNFEEFELKYYMEEELEIFNKVINKSNYHDIDQTLINEFIKIVIDNELLLHLSEDIMIDNIFMRKFSISNFETSKNIFLDLKELTLSDFEVISIENENVQCPDLSVYSNIEKMLFDNDVINNFTFFSNWNIAGTENKREHYYTTKDRGFPCVIAMCKNDFIIFWSNR